LPTASTANLGGKAMLGSVSTAIALWLVAVPVVEFVGIEDRLPRLHPGVLASALFVALLFFYVLMRYRWGRSR
jgi:hypothetical protein